MLVKQNKNHPYFGLLVSTIHRNGQIVVYRYMYLIDGYTISCIDIQMVDLLDHGHGLQRGFVVVLLRRARRPAGSGCGRCFASAALGVPHHLGPLNSWPMSHTEQWPELQCRLFFRDWIIWLYIYICVYKYMCIYMYIFICVYICIYLYVYIYLDIHIYIYMYTQMNIYIYN